MSFDSGWLVRATLSATGAGQQVVNTLHYNGDEGTLGASPAASIQALADRLRDDLMVKYRAMFPSYWTINPIVCTEERDPQNPSDPREQRSAGPGGAGSITYSGDLVPMAICAVAQARTHSVGRSFRGRLFLPPIWAEQYMSGDETTGAWNSIATNFLNAIPLAPDIVFGPSTVSVKNVVYSRTRRGRDENPYATDVTSYVLSGRLHWLRSRELGR